MKKLYNVWAIILSIGLLFSGTVFGQTVTIEPYDSTNLNWNTSQYKSYKFTHPTLGSMTFRMLLPLNYNPSGTTEYPVILMLHGRGEGQRKDANGNYVTDNNYHLIHGGVEHKNAVNTGKFPGFVIFPQSQYGFWVNNQGAPTETISVPMSRVLAMMDYLLTIHKMDRNRVYIHGLSGGAQGVWDALYRRPDLFAAAAPMSNAGHTAQAERVYRNPIWLFQGGLDANPRPMSSEAQIAAIRSYGGTPRYTVYPQTGHDTWYQAYAEPDFFSWLLSKNKMNIHVQNGISEVCPGSSMKLGVSPGFSAYEWSTGAATNDLTVTSPGTYRVRFQRATGIWSAWSNPVTITTGAPSPTPGISANNTTALSSGGSVTLTSSPANTYLWSNNAATQSITVGSAGTFSVRTALQNACLSNPADGVVVTMGPATGTFPAPTNLSGSAVDATTVNLSWTDNTSNESKFEIWSSLSSGGPYNFVKTSPANITTNNVNGLAPSTTYYFKVRAINNTGFSWMSPFAAVSTAADVTPPTAPAGLVRTDKTHNSISLKWNASTDNVGVHGYRIYNNGLQVASTTLTSFTIGNLTTNTNYAFTVRAMDAKNNLSDPSNVLNEIITFSAGLEYSYYEGAWSVLPNFNVLTAVTTGVVPNFTLTPKLRANQFGFVFKGYVDIPTAGTYTFYTSSDDGSKLYIDNAQIVDNDGTHGSRERSGTISLTAGMHAIRVNYFEASAGEILLVRWMGPGITKQDIPNARLYNVGGNSGTSNDITAPTNPTNLTASTITSRSCQLSWNASTDNVAVTGYNIYRDNILIGSSATTNYFSAGLNHTTTYVFTVRAKDAANNESGASNAISVRTNTNAIPVLAPIGNKSLTAGTTMTVSISANDVDLDVPVISVIGLPSFATFSYNGNGQGTLIISPSMSHVGTYNNIKFTANDGRGGTDEETISITVLSNGSSVPPGIPSGTTTYHRINAGGGSFTSNGITWDTDDQANPSPYLDKSSSNNTAGPIAWSGVNNTGAPNLLFGPYRYDGPWGGAMMYNLPVPNGRYQVNLYFAENSSVTGKGQRVMDVMLEGVMALNDLDLIADHKYNAVKKSFVINVNDGKIDLDFAAVTGMPMINGIEVMTSSSTTTLNKKSDDVVDLTPMQNWGGIDESVQNGNYKSTIEESVKSISITGEQSTLNGIPKVYPNPLKDSKVTIELSADSKGKVVISLYDQIGRTIYQVNRNADDGLRFEVDLSGIDMHSGTYFLNIRSDSDEKVLKLIKE